MEWKGKYSKFFLKTVSAFANFHDGQIPVGVTDAGIPVGVPDVKRLRIDVENAINDGVSPRPYFEMETIEHEQVDLLVIHVYKGEQTPYIVDRKAYGRTDTSTVEVDRRQYEELVLFGRNQTYEELPCRGQKLSFDILGKQLRDALDIQVVDSNVLKSFELMKHDVYNNAAALLADRNDFRDIGLDAICYADDRMTEITDRIALSGISILSHYTEALAFYRKHVNRRESITDARRIIHEEIPFVAFREVVANAIVHRDYGRNGHVRIEFFPDRVEVVSIGSLPPGISEEEYRNGLFSNPRNRILMEVFLRLRYIEKLGTGVRRIRRAYAAYQRKPILEVMQNSIRVILPRLEASEKENFSSGVPATLLPIEEKLYNHLQGSGQMSRNEVETFMKVGKTKATKLLHTLLEKRLIRKSGTGRETKYVSEK